MNITSTPIHCLYCNKPFIHNSLEKYDKISRCPKCHTIFVLKYYNEPDVVFWEIDVKPGIRARVYPDGGYAIVDREHIITRGSSSLVHLSIEQIQWKISKLLVFL